MTKSKDLQQKLLYLEKPSFRIEGQIKSFSDKKKLKEFVTTKPILQEILKGLLEGGREEEEQMNIVERIKWQ